MDRNRFEEVLAQAAEQREVEIVEISFDDDENVFEVIIDRKDSVVDLADCEFVHRAVLAAFDRNVEDYSLTVSSKGIDSAEADEILKTINE